MKKLRSIGHIDKNCSEVLLKTGNDGICSNLSPFSLEIVNAIFEHQITIILSQSSLNITPIVACLYAYKKNHDVLIGIPKKKFNEVYKGYTQAYFSLTYQKIVNGIISKPFFFYSDLFWCKGKIDLSTDALSNIDIETYPTQGKREFKEKYSTLMRERLTNSQLTQNPIILSVPVETSVPSNVIGEKEITFINDEYQPLNYDPHLIILESINERRFEFEHLVKISENLISSGKKVILHFSWPYLGGLNSFLSELKETHRNNIAVYHLGKRLCFEMGEKFRKPPESILHLSLEGNQWDKVYYPNDIKFLIDVYLPYSDRIDKESNVVSIANTTWPIDEVLRNIWKMDTSVDLSNMAKNILRFPPVIDVFLHPSELKVRSYIESIHSWRYIPIRDYLRSQTTVDEKLLRPVFGIFSELDSCKDLSRYLRGLHTNASPSKKTLFQMCMFEWLQSSIEKLLDENSHNEQSQDSLIKFVIAKNHPFFETRKGIFDSIRYFFLGLNDILSSSDLPRISKRGRGVFLKVHGQEVEIFDGKNLVLKNIFEKQKLKHHLMLPMEVSQYTHDGSLIVSVAIKLNERFIIIKNISENLELKRKTLDKLDIYRLNIRSDGYYSEYTLSNVTIKPNFNTNSLEVSLDGSIKNPREIKKTMLSMHFSHHNLVDLYKLDKDDINQSILLIPGPIPFQTITDRGIIITQGYASLLLPFKKIIFLTYPGINFKRIIRQIKTIEPLFKKDLTDISIRDLSYSLQQTHDCHTINLPEPIEQFDEPIDQLISEGTPFDVAVREELTNECNAHDDDERQDIISLKSIWDKLRDRSTQEGKPSFSDKYNSYSNRDMLPIWVQFDNSTPEQIAFSKGTLIRKKTNGLYLLCPVEDLKKGDEILYIETSDKLSIDNYVLKDFFDDQGLSMEQILEPFTCLKIFYNALKSINQQELDATPELEKIYWLSSKEKEKLIITITFLVNSYNADNRDDEVEKNIFWAPIISSNELREIFGKGNNTITYSKLYRVAKKLGISIAENTFNQYCSLALNEQNHYYFKNPDDLLALGRLIGHAEICDNYEIINEMGQKVGRILQIIGRSLSRVTSGNSELLSELDMGIAGLIKKCVVISEIDS